MQQSLSTLILLLLSTLLTAQDFTNLKYRSVGPARGGRSTTVTGVDSQPNVFYMGATGGGVWKTEDYGTTWKNLSDGYFASPSIGAIRVSKSNPEVVYVGTGSDGLRSNVIIGKGVYKSTDAGATWKPMGLEKTGQIGAVEIHPTDPNTAYVAAIGQPFRANVERGVYRTQDGGENWEQVLTISDTTGFVDLELMPSNPAIIYAAAWRAERKPWTVISGGKENGIYKSTNGGDNWVKIGKGLPTMMGKIDLSFSAANDAVVYALVEAKGEQAGLYRSDDRGETFRQVSNDDRLLFRAFYFTNITADPQDAETIYVVGINFKKSTDGGKSFTTIRTPHGDDHDLWINPNNSKLMIEANDGGVNISHNGGVTWSSQLNQPTAELYQVEVDNQYPYWLYAGQQDNFTTISVPSMPPYSNQTGGVGYTVNTGGCETGPAVPHPTNSDIVYANCKGRFSVYNKSTGQEKRYDVGAAYMYGHNPKDLKFRFQRVSPIHVSPHDPSIIYHASQYLHRTQDEGKTWEIISPDLTAFEADKQVYSGQPFSRDITGEEFYSTIYSVQESKIQPGLIWVGANDGPVHVSQDGGLKWKNVTPKKLPKGGRVDAVEPSPHAAYKAYIAVWRSQLGDDKPYIYKTKNFGKSWTLITEGIPTDYPVRVVRADPNRKGLLYAGTEYGMFISFNDGENWQPFQQNLPVTPITDIKIHRKDLVLSTMGRGFYILDDLSALQQGLDKKDLAQAHLFQPKENYRYHSFRNASDGMTKYPRPAVIIDYYLPPNADSILQLQIVDSAGKVLRNFSNQEIATTETSSNMSTNEERYSIASSLHTTAGLHRFRWDMRHIGAWDKKPNRRYRNGPMVSPDTYTVRLITGDQVLEQSLILKLDPRVAKTGVTVVQVKAKEKMALQVVELLSKAKLKAAAIDRKLRTMDNPRSEEGLRLQTLKEQLVTEEGSYRLPKLIDQIEYLYGITRRGDQELGKDVYKRYEELNTIFEKLVE